MKIRTVIGLTGATAASLVGVAGLAASPAGAGGNGAVNMPAADLSSYLQVPGVPLFAPLDYPGEVGPPFIPPNTKVNGNCVAAAPWLFTANPDGSPALGFNFTSGNAVAYKVDDSTPLAPTFPGGLNAEGNAQLIDFDTYAGPGTGLTGFAGPTHTWLGQNGNAKGTLVGAETVSFSGTDAAGSTISITVNPGSTTSAGGHMNGWGEEDLSCNILPGDGG